MSSAAQLTLFDARNTQDDFAVRVSQRARRLTVRVHVGGRVEVVVPKGVTPNVVRAFVHRNTSWIDKKVAQMGRVGATASTLPESVRLNATGEEFLIIWQNAADGGVLIEQNCITVRARSQAHGFELLRSWLKDAARARFLPLIFSLAQHYQYDLAGVEIRRQRTRWGSCSSRRVISLNCSLLFMTPAVVRYLMIHELTHLKHMNHSEQFWRQVCAHEPAYRELDRQLTAGWRGVPTWVFKG